MSDLNEELMDVLFGGENSKNGNNFKKVQIHYDP